MDIVDIWVNVIAAEVAAAFMQTSANSDVAGYLGGQATSSAPGLLESMDELGVATGIITTALDSSADDALALADAHPGRFLVAGGVSNPKRPTANARRVRELSEHPSYVMTRVMPVATGAPIDDPRHYPIYSVCEELGIPVGINVGVPGPKVRSRTQHPELLEEVLIDFPSLVVIGAHMGHPYEELLMNFMRKWPNLYLSCTAYAPKYIDPSLLALMNSGTYRGRVLWGSDEPWFPMRRSLAEARELPLDPEALELFLGGTARRILGRRG